LAKLKKCRRLVPILSGGVFVKKNSFRFTVRIIVLVAVFLLLPLTYVSASTALEGSGTQEEPFLIRTQNDLEGIGGVGSAGRHFRLENNIELVGPWIPIMDFRGSFDGQGFVVSNLHIPTAARRTHTGLFGTTYRAEIKNLGVIITRPPGTMGINANHGTLTQIYSGGLVAHARYTTIEKCFTETDGNAFVAAMFMRGGDFGAALIYIGGLVGLAENSTIRDSFSTADLRAEGDGQAGRGFRTGGLVGEAANSTIERCYAAGDIDVFHAYHDFMWEISQSSLWAGKLIGRNVGSTLNYSFSQEQTLLEEHIPSNKFNNQDETVLTAAQMRVRDSFTSWCFDDVWIMITGQPFPRLNFVNLPDIKITFRIDGQDITELHRIAGSIGIYRMQNQRFTRPTITAHILITNNTSDTMHLREGTFRVPDGFSFEPDRTPPDFIWLTEIRNHIGINFEFEGQQTYRELAPNGGYFEVEAINVHSIYSQAYTSVDGDDAIFTVELVLDVNNLGVDAEDEEVISIVPAPIAEGRIGGRDIPWDSAAFRTSTSVYNPTLALKSAAFSYAAYGVTDTDDRMIIAALTSMGFTDITTGNYHGRPLGGTLTTPLPAHTVGYAFARKKVVDPSNNRVETIYAIVLRGTVGESDEAEWVSNRTSLRLNHHPVYHAGMRMAFQNVAGQFALYTFRDGLSGDATGNRRVLITGHSRGGAVAGSLGRNLNMTNVTRENSVVYTFAAPKTGNIFANPLSNPNIHNVVNNADITPTITPWNTRYGRDYFFSEPELSLYNAVSRARNTPVSHRIRVHFDWVYNRPDPNTWQGAVFPSLLGFPIRSTRFGSPVDMRIYNEDGVLIGTIENNVATYHNDYEGIVMFVDGDAKYVWTLSDGDYTFKITGTGVGIMDLEVSEMEEIDVLFFEEVGRTDFNDVAVVDGKEMRLELTQAGARLIIIRNGVDVAEINEDGTETRLEAADSPGVFPSQIVVVVDETNSVEVSLGTADIYAEGFTAVSNNPDIAEIAASADDSITIGGISAGVTAITITFHGGNYTGPAQDVTIIVINQLSVQFSDGMDNSFALRVTEGKTLGSRWPDFPERSGYLFVGWFTEQDGVGAEYLSNSVISRNVNLYAYWIHFSFCPDNCGDANCTYCGFIVPPTGIPDIMTTWIAMLAMSVISAGLWVIVIRRKLRG
jgi:hypothetical protein